MSPIQVIITGIAIAIAAVGYYAICMMRVGHDDSAELFERDFLGSKFTATLPLHISPEEEQYLRDVAGDRATENYLRDGR